MRKIIAIILAASAAYLWGFAYWGVSSVPYSPWGEVSAQQDAAVSAALRAHFPGNGTYQIPGRYLPDAERRPLQENGPVAFIHITHYDGQPQFDAQVMWQGYVLYLGVAAMLAGLIIVAAPALTSFGKGMVLTSLTGLAAVVMIDFGEATWWRIDWGWILLRSLYDFIAIVIMGAVLLTVIKPYQTTPS